MSYPTRQKALTSDTTISLEQFYGELIRDYLQHHPFQTIIDAEKLCSDLDLDMHQYNLGMRWCQAQSVVFYVNDNPFLSSTPAHLGDGVIRVGGGNWSIQHSAATESATPTLPSVQASFLVNRQQVLSAFCVLFSMFLLGYRLGVSSQIFLETLVVGGLLAMVISIVAGIERRSARRSL